MPLCVTLALSADVTTTPNGKPPAADDVDMTKRGLLKSSKDEDASIKTNSLDCTMYSCTLDMSGVQIANTSGSS